MLVCTCGLLLDVHLLIADKASGTRTPSRNSGVQTIEHMVWQELSIISPLRERILLMEAAHSDPKAFGKAWAFTGRAYKPLAVSVID